MWSLFSLSLCPNVRRGHSFFSANEELLDIYSRCVTAVEVIEAQNKWLSGSPAAAQVSNKMLSGLERSGDDGAGGSSDGEEAEEDDDYRRRLNRELPPTDSEEDEGEDDWRRQVMKKRGEAGEGPHERDVSELGEQFSGSAVV